MLIFALALNLAILIPSLFAMTFGLVEAVLGPVTDARLILPCIYSAIAATSASLIALHTMSHPWAAPMTRALFAVQITYKLTTVPVADLSSPAVPTNLLALPIRWPSSQGCDRRAP